MKLLMQVMDEFLSQIVISADFAISFFYFMSAFIAFFGFLRKYKSVCIKENPRQSSVIQTDLTLVEVCKLIFGRYLRLAFPTYTIILITRYLFVYMGSGPFFINYDN
jgi:hypothetical protein